MKRFFAGLAKKARQSSRLNDDQRFGTGAWRQNRDRFIRAVDRYYNTALALHESRATPDSPTTSANEVPVDLIVDGTHRLNELVTTVDEITAWLHTHHPVTGQIIPGPTRQAVGNAPELLTKASSKVAEAVLSASMARTEAAGRPIESSAQATQRFITDAADLLQRARAQVAGPDDSR